MRRPLVASILALLALAASALAWGPSLWLAVATVPEPLADSRQGIIVVENVEGFLWDRATGEHRVHRWQRNAQGQPIRKGPFWIRWSADGPFFLTGWYENDFPVRITQRSPTGEIVVQVRFRGHEEVDRRTAPPWFEE